MQIITCLTCKTQNPIDSHFCRGCGGQFSALVQNSEPNQLPKKNKNSGIIALIIIGSVLFLCVMCGWFADKSKPTQIESTNSNTTNIQKTDPPKPTTFVELKKEVEELQKLNKDEYSDDEIKTFDNLSSQLNEIPKTDKNYKESQTLRNKLIEKFAVIAAERFLLGERPSEIDLKIAFNQYLRDVLNDYDSSEYIDYTPAIKVRIKKEPFWLSTLRLRAKNAFGAYIVRDIKMYIRNKKVVYAEGLN